MPRLILLTAEPQLALALAFVLPSELPRKSPVTEADHRPLALAAMFSDDLRRLSPKPRIFEPELPSVMKVRVNLWWSVIVQPDSVHQV